MFFLILGILSSIVFIIGDIPYIRDTLKGTTKPHRVTWGVIFLINIITLANQIASGATNSLWLVATAAIVVGIIFFASLKNGVGGHSKFDLIALTLSLIGVVAWVIIEDPLASVIANSLVGIIAVLPTFKKARKDPESETGIAYLFGSISALMAFISVNEWNIALLLPHAVGFSVQAYLVYLLYVLPKKHKNPKS